jgi:aarF domain-containing kinase
VRSFLILARYASRTVYQGEVEELQERGSILWPRNLFSFVRALSSYMRVKLQLEVYEWWLEMRRLAGLANVM